METKTKHLAFSFDKWYFRYKNIKISLYKSYTSIIPIFMVHYSKINISHFKNNNKGYNTVWKEISLHMLTRH